MKNTNRTEETKSNIITIQSYSAIKLGTQIERDGKLYEVISNNEVVEVQLKEIAPMTDLEIAQEVQESFNSEMYELSNAERKVQIMACYKITGKKYKEILDLIAFRA